MPTKAVEVVVDAFNDSVRYEAIEKDDDTITLYRVVYTNYGRGITERNLEKIGDYPIKEALEYYYN